MYDQSGESLGENNRSSWTQSYVNFAGRHIAIYANNTTYFTHVYSLGSTVMVSDYTGAIVEDKLFYPFGQHWQQAGTLYEERFAKLQHRDVETGFDPTPHRIYCSAYGRWLSPDPFGGEVSDPQSLNRYAYAGNRPGVRTDSSGLCPSGGPHPDDREDDEFRFTRTDSEGDTSSFASLEVIADAIAPSDGGSGPIPLGLDGGCGGRALTPQERAIDYLARHKDCQNFILQTILKVFQLMDKGGPLTEAQKQADTVGAFELDLSLMNIIQSAKDLPYGAAALATGLGTITVGPAFGGCASAQQSDILIHEVLHLAPPKGTSYDFLDRALADAWGLKYTVVGKDPGQTVANASAAFEKLLEDPKNCGPAK